MTVFFTAVPEPEVEFTILLQTDSSWMPKDDLGREVSAILNSKLGDLHSQIIILLIVVSKRT